MKQLRMDEVLTVLDTIQFRFCLAVSCLRSSRLKYTKTVVLPVLYGRETWSVTLRDAKGPKGEEVVEDGENCIMKSFIICSRQQI